ncbi:hypothetical protein CR513_49913, partial [Mucuna pruriens]
MSYLQQRMQNWQQGRLVLYDLLMVGLLLLLWRKSSKTVLLHLGHLGSSSESITYIRQRGQPTKTMEVASGLLEYPRLLLLLSSWLSSVETHELGGDVGDTVADRVGDSSLRSTTLGGDRFNFKSSFGPLPFLPLMVWRRKGMVNGLKGSGRRRSGTSKVICVGGLELRPFYMRKMEGQEHVAVVPWSIY